MRLLFIFIALAVAVAIGLVAYQILPKKEPETSTSIIQQPTVEVRESPKGRVFVARQDIPIGSIVKRPMLDIVDYQQNLILPDMATVEDPGTSPIDGMVSRSPVIKGEVIMKNKFANPKDPSFLAAAMAEGMRLVTVGVDAISGDGGFIYPGDHVDVIITRDIPLGQSNSATFGVAPTSMKTSVSEVLIPNIRVLAVNQKSTSANGEGPTIPNNVSLEVSQLDAERLRLAENGNGKLSLVLRALKDKDAVNVPRPAGTGDLSRTTSAAYFPILYENLNSYTPKIVTTPPGNSKVAEAAAANATAIANAAPDTTTPTAAGTLPGSGSNSNSVDLIRGVKKESIQIPSSAPSLF